MAKKNISAAFLQIEELSELPKNTQIVPGDLFICRPNGKGETIDIEIFSQILNKFALPLKTTDPTPTVIGWYKPTDAGLYNNAGGLEAQVGYDTLFYYSGTMWTRTQVKMPISPLDVHGGALSYDLFISNNKPANVYSNEQFSNFSLITIAANNIQKRYYTLFPVQNEDCYLKSISIKGNGLIDLYKMKPDGSGELFLKTIDLGSIDEVHTLNMSNLLIEAGFLLGISGQTTGLSRFYYISPKPSASDFNLIQTPPYEESNNLIIAYSYILESESGTKYYLTPNDLNELKEESITTKMHYDDFSSQQPDWIFTGWNYSAGKFTSSATGINNNLFNNKIWNLNKRKARIKIIPSSDTDFRIHLLSDNSTKKGEGSSLFSVNFAENKLKIFNVLTTWPSPNITSDGVSETSVLKEISFSIPYVVGREYLIELKYIETKHILILTDTVTTQNEILEFDGWYGGRQQQSYSFYVYAGGSVSVNKFEVLGVDNVENLFVGDSITEGVMVVDKSKRWWKQMEPNLAGITAVSARGGASIIDTLKKKDNEFLKLKPKRIIFLIGINGIGTTPQFNALLEMCIDNNIIPCFAYQPCFNFTNPVNSNMEAAIEIKYRGFRFDLATSIDNNGVTCNTVLFYDGVHPIESGCTEMAKRQFDVDFMK